MADLIVRPEVRIVDPKPKTDAATPEPLIVVGGNVQAAKLIRRVQPYTKKIAQRATWVEPTLLAEIEYRAKSAGGKVRHPVFKGLRDDL